MVSLGLAILMVSCYVCLQACRIRSHSVGLQSYSARCPSYKSRTEMSPCRILTCYSVDQIGDRVRFDDLQSSLLMQSQSSLSITSIILARRASIVLRAVGAMIESFAIELRQPGVGLEVYVLTQAGLSLSRCHQ